MTLQTQCPNCQSIYPIPPEQVNNSSAKARCPKCKTTFLINENSIGHGAGVSENINQVSSVQKNNEIDTNSQGTNAFEPPITEGLGSSVSNPIQQTTQQSIEEDVFGSLDDMSSWLDQQAESISGERMGKDTSAINTEEQQIQKEMQAESQPQQEATEEVSQKMYQQSQRISSNHVEENINDGKDEAWLDQILEKDVTVTTDDHFYNNTIDKNGLNDLMSDYGVSTENPDKTQLVSNEVDQLSKMSERVLGDRPTQQQESSKKSPAVFFVWLLGCFLLLALLLVQYVIFNINTLVKDPEKNSKLLSVCKMLSCKLPNANVDGVKITYVHHRASFIKNDKGNADIIGGMVNQSTGEQLYPNLKITIQGSQGLLGEFVAAPKDYLISKQVQMAVGQDKLFMFTVPLNNEQISKIEITPFY